GRPVPRETTRPRHELGPSERCRGTPGYAITGTVVLAHRSKPFRLLLLGALVAALSAAAGVVPSVAAPAPRPARADPALLAKAALHPRSRIPVILRADRRPAAERLVRSLGGRVTTELPVIHGF